MPFGEPLYAGIGGRTPLEGYSPTGNDSLRKAFTGYEKDSETDLEYSLARMYENSHGRFTTVDPLISSSSPLNPQSLNRYVHTGNNPVNRVDSNGLKWVRDSSGIYWIPDDEPLNGRENVTGIKMTIGRGGCTVAGCVAEGDEVTFEKNKSITYHNRPGGAAVVTVTQEVQRVFSETASAISDALQITPRPFAPTLDPPSTVDIPGAPSGGPLEPTGGSDSGSNDGSETSGEIDGSSSGDWQVDAAKLLYTLTKLCWFTSCWDQSNGGEEEIELYRGIPNPGGTIFHDDKMSNNRYYLGAEGYAIPNGGHSSPEEHARGDTDSIFTSWTTSRGVANFYANQWQSGGVVLTQKFPRSRVLVGGEDYYTEHEWEDEHLITGPVTGASVKIIPPQ